MYWTLCLASFSSHRQGLWFMYTQTAPCCWPMEAPRWAKACTPRWSRWGVCGLLMSLPALWCFLGWEGMGRKMLWETEMSCVGAIAGLGSHSFMASGRSAPLWAPVSSSVHRDWPGDHWAHFHSPHPRPRNSVGGVYTEVVCIWRSWFSTPYETPQGELGLWNWIRVATSAQFLRSGYIGIFLKPILS